jgi:hypothetical protein
VASTDGSKQTEAAAARAIWEDLAVRARTVHCPTHFVQPWRIDVIGDTPGRMRLNVSGCCPQLGEAVTALIRTDPRVGGPR